MRQSAARRRGELDSGGSAGLRLVRVLRRRHRCGVSSVMKRMTVPAMVTRSEVKLLADRWMLAAGLMVLGLGARGTRQSARRRRLLVPAVHRMPVAPAPVEAASGGTIRGTVKAGAVPLPGVAVTATQYADGKERYATTTDVTGAFAMAIPRNGRYVVRAELAAFASETKELLLNAAGRERRQAGAGGGVWDAAGFASGGNRMRRQAASVARTGARGSGMQALSVLSGSGDAADASAGAGNAGAQLPSLARSWGGRCRSGAGFGCGERADGTDEWPGELQRGRDSIANRGCDCPGPKAGWSDGGYGELRWRGCWVG